jgi:hypothetical protein
MIKDKRQALKKKGYTADEIELLLNSLTELLDKLRMEALWKRLAYRCAVHRRIRCRS